MSNIRTFTAINVSPKVRAGAGHCIERLQTAGADYNWVPAENLHLTLNFLGDVPENEIPDLCGRVKSVVESYSPFGLTVSGMGGFPQNERPRVVWLGVQEGAKELCEMQQALSAMFRDYGFPKDRTEYHPHLTLGRLRRGGRWNQALTDVIQKHSDHSVGGCQIDEVVVNSSHRDKLGMTYTAMSRIKLLG